METNQPDLNKEMNTDQNANANANSNSNSNSNASAFSLLMNKFTCASNKNTCKSSGLNNDVNVINKSIFGFNEYLVVHSDKSVDFAITTVSTKMLYDRRIVLLKEGDLFNVVILGLNNNNTLLASMQTSEDAQKIINSISNVICKKSKLRFVPYLLVVYCFLWAVLPTQNGSKQINQFNDSAATQKQSWTYQNPPKIQKSEQLVIPGINGAQTSQSGNVMPSVPIVDANKDVNDPFGLKLNPKK